MCFESKNDKICTFCNNSLLADTTFIYYIPGVGSIMLSIITQLIFHLLRLNPKLQYYSK